MIVCCILGSVLVGSLSSQDSKKFHDAEIPPLRDAEKWLGPQKLAKFDMQDSGEIEYGRIKFSVVRRYWK
jgi:hypothetical protein